MEKENNFVIGYRWTRTGSVLTHQYTDIDGNVSKVEFDMKVLYPEFDQMPVVAQDVFELGHKSGLGDGTQIQGIVMTPKERQTGQISKWRLWTVDGVFRSKSERARNMVKKSDILLKTVDDMDMEKEMKDFYKKNPDAFTRLKESLLG